MLVFYFKQNVRSKAVVSILSERGGGLFLSCIFGCTFSEKIKYLSVLEKYYELIILVGDIKELISQIHRSKAQHV